jgi:hypothetical protein
MPARNLQALLGRRRFAGRRSQGQRTEFTTVKLDEEPNAGKAWTEEELELLRQLAAAQTPTRQIAEQLGRSEYSVRSKASQTRTALLGGKISEASGRPR